MQNASKRNILPVGANTNPVDALSRPSISEAIGRKSYSQTSAEKHHSGILNGYDEVTFLRLPEVKEITGLSKSSLYALMLEKNFPTPVRLGARTVAWVRSEIRQWALDRIQGSR